jgi:DNA-binding protein HU-beta
VTRTQLIDAVHKRFDGITKKDMTAIINMVFSEIKNSLIKDEIVEIRSFGTFKIKARAAKKGRNPQTGEPVDIPARNVPVFKPGSEFKRLVKLGVKTPSHPF